MSEGARLTRARGVKNYVLAGRATVTLRSVATGTRFTFRVQSPKEERRLRSGSSAGSIWFVSVLTGSDNESQYRYLGQIRDDLHYEHGWRSKIRADAPSSQAFAWTWNQVIRPERDELLSSKLEVWHEGRCGKCGRKLTDPESIRTGLGPVCIAN